jgi:hypothetical protein
MALMAQSHNKFIFNENVEDYAFVLPLTKLIADLPCIIADLLSTNMALMEQSHNKFIFNENGTKPRELLIFSVLSLKLS